MSCYHLFLGVEAGTENIDKKYVSKKTITEMVRISDSIINGRYLVNMQISPFVFDAAPSLPILFKIEESIA